MDKELTILIPARKEEFLSRTIEDILANIEADTEVIAVLDGEWADPAIPKNERVNVIYVPKSVGQRAATNLACKLAKGRYVMKVDAHCSFDKGFDRKMIEAFRETGDNVVMVPVMRNLWIFDWKCPKCGFRIYQDKSNICPTCKVEMYKKIVWKAKKSPQSTSYCFDSEPHFQYWNSYRVNQKGDLPESMSIQGSCFMCTREKYWELELGNEELGSWGNQGIQVACSFWLSGGKVIVNRRTWYAHCFRTKGCNGFGFPYSNPESEVQKNKKKVRDLFWNKKHPKQIYPVSWLVEKFWPTKGWTEKDLEKLKKEENGIKA